MYSITVITQIQFFYYFKIFGKIPLHVTDTNMAHVSGMTDIYWRMMIDMVFGLTWNIFISEGSSANEEHGYYQLEILFSSRSGVFLSSL